MIGHVQNPIIKPDELGDSEEEQFAQIVTYIVMRNPDGVRGLLAENGLLPRRENDDLLIDNSLKLFAQNDEAIDEFLALHPDKEILAELIQDESSKTEQEQEVIETPTSDALIEENPQEFAEKLATEPVTEKGEEESLLERWFSRDKEASDKNTETSTKVASEQPKKCSDFEVDGKQVKVSNRVLLVILLLILGLLVYKTFVADKE